MSDEKQKQEEIREDMWAYRFAEQATDPEFARQEAERERNELRGEMLGNAIFETHAAYLSRKQQQQQRYADWLAGGRAGRLG